MLLSYIRLYPLLNYITMLYQLVALVLSHARQAGVANPAVPNEQNEAVIGEATHSIAAGLQDALAQGNVQDVMSLFGSDGQVDSSHPVVNNIAGNLVSSLTQKFNLNSGTAASIASSLIPSVLGSLVKKTNDPNDTVFSLDGISTALTGGSTQGMDLGGLLGKFTGSLDQNGDGKLDLSDLTAAISGGAKQQQSSGGIGGLLGSLFGK